MVKSQTRFLLLNAGLMTLLLGSPDADLKQIQESLICTCECNMTVAACEGSMNCVTAKKLTEEGEFLISNHLTEAQILDVFVMRYGEAILASPTKSGFNLIAWVLPYLVLGTIGFGVTQLLRRWAQSPGERRRAYPSPGAKSGSKEYEQQLDAYLREMD